MLRRLVGAGGLAASAAAVCSMTSSRAESLAEKRRAGDVLVVGGGIVGTTVAYHLALRGVSVTLVDRSSCGSEASGLSAGTIWCAGVPSSFDPSSAAMYMRAGSADLLEKLGGCDFCRCGALDVAATPEERAYLLADYEQCKRKGLVLEWL